MRYRCIVTATDRAYAYAKERIVDGRLPGGELISEGEVASGVGVSRTPVREAFLRLEAEGLLRLYPKRGALVVPVSAAEVESVMETRLLLERFAIEKVIRSGAELGKEPEKTIARQEGLAARGDIVSFVEVDREFHRLFVAAAHNPILLGLHDSLRSRQSRMGLAALSRDPDRTHSILEEHRALTTAVAARDVVTAGEILDDHLGATLHLLRAGVPG